MKVRCSSSYSFSASSSRSLLVRSVSSATPARRFSSRSSCSAPCSAASHLFCCSTRRQRLLLRLLLLCRRHQLLLRDLYHAHPRRTLPLHFTAEHHSLPCLPKTPYRLFRRLYAFSPANPSQIPLLLSYFFLYIVDIYLYVPPTVNAHLSLPGCSEIAARAGAISPNLPTMAQEISAYVWQVVHMFQSASQITLSHNAANARNLACVY